jgi:hypothetical protein
VVNALGGYCDTISDDFLWHGAEHRECAANLYGVSTDVSILIFHEWHCHMKLPRNYEIISSKIPVEAEG